MAARKKVAVLYRGLGRRKSSTARVIVKPGNGTILVNGRDVNEYMPFATLVMDLKQPLTLTSTQDQFDVSVNVVGGGFTGQAGAIRLGIARALLQASPDYRPVLNTIQANYPYIVFLLAFIVGFVAAAAIIFGVYKLVVTLSNKKLA